MTDAPPVVRPMIGVLRDMGQYKYDPADVYRDWVDYMVACLLFQGDKELGQKMEAKYRDDYPKLNELAAAWLDVVDKNVSDCPGGWFDGLGVVYEYLASTSKKQWLGQFFTPQPVCDLMTGLAGPGKEGERGKTVNDPAVGSGRMLLSYNSYHPGNYMYGEDLDPICAKMCALNLTMHGCQGQVVCMDSISFNDYRFGYQINPLHAHGSPGFPHLWPLAKENSRTWLMGQQRLGEWREQQEAKAKPAQVLAPKPKPEVEVPQRAQLSLF